MRGAGLIAAAALWLAGPSQAGEVAEVLRSGDMDRVARTVEALYGAQGVTLPDGIEWEFRDHRTTYSYYQPDVRIVSGSIPAPGDVDDYWSVWNAALTGGLWSSEDFFVSAEDAADMARMHQFILAVHEAAHAVTYRYDPDHLARHGHSVGCREYYADRLVAAILQDLGAREAEIERLRARYLDLSLSIGAAIPDRFRTRPTTLDEFEADCAVMVVADPDPDDLRAYASAWFIRYAALLPARLPPLPEVVARHLTGRLDERMAGLPPAPAARTATVATLGAIAAANPRVAVALSPEGTLRTAMTLARDAAGRLRLELGPTQRRIVAVENAPPPDGPDRATGIAEVPGGLLLSLDIGGAGVLLRLTPDPDAADIWKAVHVVRAKGPARLVAAGDAALWVETRTAGGWRTRRIDPATGALSGALDLPAAPGRLVGGMPNGHLLASDRRSLIEIGPAGFGRLGGSGLPGNRDGAALSAEFQVIVTATPRPDGAIDIVDLGSSGGAWLRRWSPSP